MDIKDSSLEHVMTELAYTVCSQGTAQIRVFPPSSGRVPERPDVERCRMPIYDCRPIAAKLTLDEAGFEFLTHASRFVSFYNSDRVRSEYYPETAALLKEATGAQEVFIFDHNVRSRVRSEAGENGEWRKPVQRAAHINAVGGFETLDIGADDSTLCEGRNG